MLPRIFNCSFKQGQNFGKLMTSIFLKAIDWTFPCNLVEIGLSIYFIQSGTLFLFSIHFAKKDVRHLASPILAGVSQRGRRVPSLLVFCSSYYFYPLPVKKGLWWTPPNYTPETAPKTPTKYTAIPTHAPLVSQRRLCHLSSPNAALSHQTSPIRPTTKSALIPSISLLDWLPRWPLKCEIRESYNNQQLRIMRGFPKKTIDNDPADGKKQADWEMDPYKLAMAIAEAYRENLQLRMANREMRRQRKAIKAKRRLERRIKAAVELGEERRENRRYRIHKRAQARLAQLEAQEMDKEESGGSVRL